MVLPDEESQDESPEDPPVSVWSERMPRSVAGLAVGALVCVVVIALCAGALAWALDLLVAG